MTRLQDSLQSYRNRPTRNRQEGTVSFVRLLTEPASRFNFLYCLCVFRFLLFPLFFLPPAWVSFALFLLAS